MYRFIDPDEHNKTSSPFPYWITITQSLTVVDERALIAKISEVIGDGSALPNMTRAWTHSFIDGYAVFMFKTEEDRTMASFMISQ